MKNGNGREQNKNLYAKGNETKAGRNWKKRVHTSAALAFPLLMALLFTAQPHHIHNKNSLAAFNLQHLLEKRLPAMLKKYHLHEYINMKSVQMSASGTLIYATWLAWRIVKSSNTASNKHLLKHSTSASKLNQNTYKYNKFHFFRPVWK